MLVYSIILIGIIISFYTVRGISGACQARIIWRQMGNLYPFSNHLNKKDVISSAGAASYLIGWAFLWIWIVLGLTELVFLLYSRTSGGELICSITFLAVGLFFICYVLYYYFKNSFGIAAFQDPASTNNIPSIAYKSIINIVFLVFVNSFLAMLIIAMLVAYINNFRSEKAKNKPDIPAKQALVIKGPDGKILDRVIIEVSNP